MNALIVVYDIADHEQGDEQIIEYINCWPNTIELRQGVWLVLTDDVASELEMEISMALGPEDRLWVMRVDRDKAYQVDFEDLVSLPE